MSGFLLLIQLAVTVIMGVYFYTQLRTQRTAQPAGRGESAREMENLRKMRAVSLTEPLAEHVRPQSFDDIIGQEEGVKALMAILCGKNPQHVIIYGPPGIGKTCAARLALEAAKKSPGTPFKPGAPFIEMDATCVRFDERAIAEPMTTFCRQKPAGRKRNAIRGGRRLSGRSVPRRKRAVTRSLRRIAPAPPAAANPRRRKTA